MFDGEFYFEIDEALMDVARRSFYEDCTVYPAKIATLTGEDVIGYVVRNDYHDISPDGVYWTYDGGIEEPPFNGDMDITRLFEAAEFWDTSGHVRYSFEDTAVAALEAGHAVTFSYQVVSVIECDDCPDREPYYCDEDHVAGWCVVATWHED